MEFTLYRKETGSRKDSRTMVYIIQVKNDEASTKVMP